MSETTQEPLHSEPTPPASPQQNEVVISFPIVEPYLTYLLLGILVLIHVYALSLDRFAQNRFYYDYVMISERVTAGEYYRLFTNMFLHSSTDLSHLLFNGIALYAFGRDVERPFGHWRFILIYILGGLTGSVTSYVLTQGASVGASGAVFSIFGAMMIYFYHNRHLYQENAFRQIRQLIVLALLNFGIGFWNNRVNSAFKIDNAGHLGGFLGGLLLAWFMCPIFKIERIGNEYRVVDENPLPRWIIVPVIYAAVLAVMVLLITGSRA